VRNVLGGNDPFQESSMNPDAHADDAPVDAPAAADPGVPSTASLHAITGVEPTKAPRS
jgi:aerobic C4-dicarboxylate transport protein